MNKAIIYLTGLTGIDKPEKLETFEFEDDKELKARLKELQKGYLEGKDKSKITEFGASVKDGTKRKAFHIQSDVDWGHTAIYCGKKFIIK